MTIEERVSIFGDPSNSLVAEAVWMFHEGHGDWPLIEEATDALAALAEIDEEEAERRVREAIASGELEPMLRGGTFLVGYSIRPPQSVADRIARRYLDVTLERRDREEQL